MPSSLKIIKRLIYTVSALLGCTVLWLCWSAYAIASFDNLNLPTRSDCAIVLGAAVYGSKPSPVFEERIRHAIILYRDGRVRKLIFTGGIGPDKAFAESTVAAQYAIQAGVPAADIYTETQSRTTLQNLSQAQHLMRQHGLHSAVIVSDPLHLRRAQTMASDLQLNAVTSATPSTRFRSFSKRMAFLLRELYFSQTYLLTKHQKLRDASI